MPSVSLCHLHTPEIAEMGEYSLGTKTAYCERWGFGIEVAAERIDSARHASWSKILLMKDALCRHEWAWWIDADAVITNPEVDVIQAACDDTAELVISNDGNGLNCGSFLVRSTPRAIAFLDAVYARTEFINDKWWEQRALQECVRSGSMPISVRVVPKRTLNSYPEDWRKGDIVLHAPNRSNRLDVLKRFVGLAYG